jgi:hypothetical protein
MNISDILRVLAVVIVRMNNRHYHEPGFVDLINICYSILFYLIWVNVVPMNVSDILRVHAAVIVRWLTSSRAWLFAQRVRAHIFVLFDDVSN